MYKSKLNLIDTEIGIKLVKDTFEANLAKELKLLRVSAPLFVKKSSGLNDDLNGEQQPVSFKIKGVNEELEIVHSLAKWKRLALKVYNIPYESGIYTDMNAIRKEEDLDNLHSIYVDQWDWEKHIKEEDRNIKYLKLIVNKIYKSILETQNKVLSYYPILDKIFPDKVTFITSQELLKKYPTLTAEEREKEFAKKHLAIFIIGIGNKLSNGLSHGSRAPDYDDWNLNGDLIIYYKDIDKAVEISSMGIRVDKNSLLNQLTISNNLERKNMPFHKLLLEDKLPLSIGGGIGQSRLCLLLLNKRHIGEVQSSIWPDYEINNALKEGNKLL